MKFVENSTCHLGYAKHQSKFLKKRREEAQNTIIKFYIFLISINYIDELSHLSVYSKPLTSRKFDCKQDII